MRDVREPLTRRERELSDDLLAVVQTAIRKQPGLDWSVLLRAMDHARGVVAGAARQDREQTSLDHFPPRTAA
jgi:hypothetical protein